MSDKIAIMNKGRLEQLGSPEEVYDSPVTPFVASFLGECNLIEGMLLGTNGNSAVFEHHRLGCLPGCLNKKADYCANSAAVYCVRPENINMHLTGSFNAKGSNSICIKGVITKCIYQGIVTRHIIRVNNVDIMADTLGKGTFVPGEKVTLTWQLKDGIILPKPGDAGDDYN